MSDAVDISARAYLRQAILDQLAYLLDEIDALEPIIGRIPDALQTVRPFGQRSLREIYGLLATYDRQVYLPRFHRMVAEEEPTFVEADEDALLEAANWNEVPLKDILDPIREARRALLSFLEALPEADWSRTAYLGEHRLDVYRLAHHITQHDADLLRTVGQRLHESHLTTRAEDLPK